MTETQNKILKGLKLKQAGVYSKYTEVKDIWDALFKNLIFENKNMYNLSFHAYVGTFLNAYSFGDLKQPTVWIDYRGNKMTFRLNTFVIQRSGSGKSETMKLVYKCLAADKTIKKHYGLEITDAALVGSVEGQGKTAETKYGMLSDHDLIIWDEGAALLSSGAYNESLQNILQMALDEPGRVSKVLASMKEPIEYATKTTVMTSTYPRPEIGEVILTRGLLQRFLVSYNEVDTNYTIRFLKHQMPDISNKDVNEAIMLLNSKMREVCDQASVLKVPTESQDLMKEKIVKLLEVSMGDFEGKKEEVLSSFVSRFNTFVILASHFTIFRGGEEVSKSDVEMAWPLYKSHIQSIAKLLESVQMKSKLDEKSMIEKFIVNFLKKPANKGGVIKKDLIEIVKDSLDVQITNRKVGVYLNEMMKYDKTVQTTKGEYNREIVMHEKWIEEKKKLEKQLKKKKNVVKKVANKK